MRRACLLLAVLLAPLAGARVVTDDAPRDFSALDPLWEDSIATLVNGTVARYWWGNGTIAPLVYAGAFTRYAISPDGAWVVKRHLEITEDDAIVDQVVALEVATGARTVLRDGALHALASGGPLVAVTTGGNASVWAWRWGAWSEPIELRAAPGPEPGGLGGPRLDASRPPDGARVFVMAVSPDGRFVAFVDGGAHAFDVERAAALPDTGAAGFTDSVVDIAFSPDSARLAILTSQPGRFSELRTYAVTMDGLAPLHVWRRGEEGVALAWGTPGLAVVLARHNDPYGPIADALVTLHADARDLRTPREASLNLTRVSGSAAFQRDRLLVGLEDGFVALNGELAELFRARPGEPPRFARSVEAPPEPTLIASPAPPPGEEPGPEARSVVGAPGAALVALAVAAISAARRPCRRRP